MLTREDIRMRRAAITSMAARHGADNVRIFGSFARDDAADTSDSYLLVRSEPEPSLMDHGMLIDELEGLLGVKVDVVSEGALSP